MIQPVRVSLVLVCLLSAAAARAQDPADFKTSVDVVGVMPLPGVELPATQVPAPTQTATDEDILQTGALDVSDFLNRRFTSVYVNETQNNPFQPDINYRGYTASPLLGTPQGVSLYMDGVRLNQPFGDVVSWDLLPRIAIGSTTLMAGSNPLFGLNTLGGALALETKSGNTNPGTTVQATYGSSLRRALEIEHGGQTATGRLHWYVAGNVFAEDGWRDNSPTDVRQLFGKVGWVRDAGSLTVSAGQAVNSLTGNGLQEFRLLDNDYSSIYTRPDTTDNRSTLLTLQTMRRLSERLSLSAVAYYRDLRTESLNGDINEESLDQSLYQPSAAERLALATIGITGIPPSGLNASNTPWPSHRCIANGLLEDEPSEKCNGLINTTESTQRMGGLSGQVTHAGTIGGHQNRLTVGGGFDRAAVSFGQITELGYLNPDHSVTGIGAYGDGGLTGGDADGEPYDTRVDLTGNVTTFSLFATDTLPLGGRAHVTLSGRYNRTSIVNRDQINPGGGAASLDGDHVFARFNPATGLTVDVSPRLNLYAGYNEGSRAATSIELGCANPEEPCRLPNAMAGDPPLNQVVTRTIEGGLRGSNPRLAWNAGYFLAGNSDDILFVTSEQSGYGYFRNFGKTRRQGIELGGRTQAGRVTVGAGYTWLRATFESEETVNGSGNSTNDAAEEGEPGLEGAIEIEPGDRMPFVPSHMMKAYGDVRVTDRLNVDLNLIVTGGSYARGNENNAHESDGTYYLGDGWVDGYAVANLNARYDLTSRVQITLQLNNLFDSEYASGGQLGPAGFDANGIFQSRTLPPVNGEYPVPQTTFLAPGAPFRAWLGLRLHF